MICRFCVTKAPYIYIPVLVWGDFDLMESGMTAAGLALVGWIICRVTRVVRLN